MKEKKQKLSNGGNSKRKTSHNTTDSSYADNMCIFRMFASCQRPETISYRDLNTALKHCCAEDQIGEVYMALLKNDPSKQHVSKKHASKNFSSIVQKYTNMDEDECEEVCNKLTVKG